MFEFADLLERDMRVIAPAEFDLTDVRRRRQRRERNARVGSAVVALLVAAVATWALVRTFAHIERKIPGGKPPTGTIVFSQAVHGPDAHVYTLGQDGVVRRLLPNRGDGFSLSPDGSRVLYADIDVSRANWVLPAVVDLDGSGRRLLRTSAPASGVWPVTWSPDGTRILVQGDDAQDRSANGLYTERRDGGDVVRITSPPGRRTDFGIGYSPDGSRILFFRSANDVAAHNLGAVRDLFAVNPNGSGLVRLNPRGTVIGPFDSGLAGTPPSPVLDLREVSWSPDGSRVAFAAAIGTPGQARHGDAARGLFVVNADGTGAHQIVPSAQILDAQWSPDGRWIAFSQADPGPDIFLVHPDGTALRQLTSSNDGLGSWGPVWSPDGSALLFTRNPGLDEFDSTLWFVDVDGSGLTRLTILPAYHFSYGWSSQTRRS